MTKVLWGQKTFLPYLLHSFNKYLLGPYYLSAPVRQAEDIQANQRDSIIALEESAAQILYQDPPNQWLQDHCDQDSEG